jgi:hypothetical protein
MIGGETAALRRALAAYEVAARTAGRVTVYEVVTSVAVRPLPHADTAHVVHRGAFIAAQPDVVPQVSPISGNGRPQAAPFWT